MEKLNSLILENIAAISLIVLLFFLGLLAWNIFLQMKISRKNKDLSTKDGSEDLKDIILEQKEEIKILDKDIQELYAISNKINAISQKGIRKVGLIRFNPFKDIGGDQSFSLALLNGKNNGCVISSLHTREGTHVYCKSIIEGETEKYPLAKEEEKAIKLAIKKEQKKL